MIENCFEPAWQHRGLVARTWGKDSTGMIEYRFNNQGFRSEVDYDHPCRYAFFGNSIVFGVGVPVHQTITAFFPNSQNYGLSGNYMNHHSVTNLERFLSSPLYTPETKLIFFWIDRQEPIDQMIDHVNNVGPKVLHISSGSPRLGAFNLMPDIDSDVSGTHPGPITHKIWAKTIDLLIKHDRYR